MALSFLRAKPRALTAAAGRPARFGRPAVTASASPSNGSAPSGLSRLDAQWQREALRLYREVGECWNPAQFYSRALERIRFYPAIRTARGQPEEVTEGPLLDLFRRIKTPSGAPGDLAPLAGAYGRLQFVIGDGYLLISEQDDEEAWEYVSPLELRTQREPRNGPMNYWRVRTPGATQEELVEADDEEFEPVGNRVRVFRLWRPSPEFTGMADSPIRPVLRLYLLLERLTAAATAEASSRAAQRGAWFVPEELSFGPVDPSLAEDPDEDPLIADLKRAMAHAIQNPDSAEAMAPFVLRGPGVTQTAGGAIPTHQLVAWLPMGPQDRYPERQMWDAVIARIASSVDMPKEMLTGMGDTSHWTSWLLSEEGFTSHTGPVLTRFCNDMAGAYLRPAAIRDEIEGAEQATIWYDASAAVTHPDKTGTALKAHDAGIVSDDWTREQIGAPDDAAPSDEELERRMLLKGQQFPSDSEPRPTTGETNPAEGGTGADANEGPPKRNQPNRRSETRAPAPQGPGGMTIDLAQMVVGAARLQLDWSRERAGNRLLRRAQSCHECRDLVKGVASPLVPAVLGRDQVLTVLEGHASEADLVEGTADRFARCLRGWGISGGWPDQLGQMVEQHAQRTLYETEVPPMPPGFHAACRRALEAA